MTSLLSQIVDEAARGASERQVKLVVACAVIAAGYAIARTIYFIWSAMNREQAPAPAPAPAAIAPSPVPAQAVDPKLIAILTAAATAAMGGRAVAVTSVTFINHNTISGWAEAGRIGIHSSHNIRR